MRRLIVNADDFGLTQGVNRAIVEAHRHGIVTSSTLMAKGQAFDDASQRVNSTPRLSVGCHVVLVDGMPVLEDGQTPTLSNRKFPDGRFYQSLSGFALRATSGRIDADEIEAEATAQIRKLQAAGIAVSHLDTHKHTHIFPRCCAHYYGQLEPAAYRLCVIPSDRSTYPSWQNTRACGSGSAKSQCSAGLGKTFRRSVAGAGMLTTDGTVGIVTTGAMDREPVREYRGQPPGRHVGTGLSSWLQRCRLGQHPNSAARVPGSGTEASNFA